MTRPPVSFNIITFFAYLYFTFYIVAVAFEIDTKSFIVALSWILSEYTFSQNNDLKVSSESKILAVILFACAIASIFLAKSRLNGSLYNRIDNLVSGSNYTNSIEEIESINTKIEELTLRQGHLEKFTMFEEAPEEARRSALAGLVSEVKAELSEKEIAAARIEDAKKFQRTIISVAIKRLKIHQAQQAKLATTALISGISVGLLIALFFYDLASSGSISATSGNIPETPTPSPTKETSATPPVSTLTLLLSYLPKLSLLIIGETLAFFLLKLHYRAGQESRFFQNEITNFEHKALALYTCEHLELKSDISDLVKAIIADDRNKFIDKDKTTTEIEMGKINEASSRSLIDQLAKIIEALPTKSK